MISATPGERLDARTVDAAVVADEPDRRPLRARHRPRRVTHLLDDLDEIHYDYYAQTITAEEYNEPINLAIEQARQATRSALCCRPIRIRRP